MALKNQDSIKLAKLAHPTLGIRFSPYIYVEADDVRLSASKVEYIFSSIKYIYGAIMMEMVIQLD